MKTYKSCLSLLAVAAIATLAGCSMSTTKSADVSRGIRTSLDRAGLKSVSVTGPPGDLGEWKKVLYGPPTRLSIRIWATGITNSDYLSGERLHHLHRRSSLNAPCGA